MSQEKWEDVGEGHFLRKLTPEWLVECNIHCWVGVEFRGADKNTVCVSALWTRKEPYSERAIKAIATKTALKVMRKLPRLTPCK